jgi:serine/threonine protein kinase
MAELFLAKLTGPAGFERLVVVKRLAATLADDPAAMRALFEEARIVATLSHANIVQVFDVDLAGGQVSIVMELLHGHDVQQLCRRVAPRGGLPLDHVLTIALSVCAGLHHAHERRAADGRPLNIVHRDVSPQNVFVTYDGTVKLVDFGIARSANRTYRTEDGIIKGKAGFMAPEQVRPRSPIDRRVDVWATSALIYWMTTGAPPVAGMSYEAMVALTTREPRKPSELVSGYPPELEAIVMRGLSRDPDMRFETADALRKELDDFARSRTLDLSPFTLSSFVETAFAAELAAYKRAQVEGRSLADYVARRSIAVEAVDAAEVVTTNVAPSPRASEPAPEVAAEIVAVVDAPRTDVKPRSRRLWMFAAAPLAVGTLVGWLMVRDRGHTRDAAAIHTSVPAGSATPTAILPTLAPPADASPPATDPRPAVAVDPTPADAAAPPETPQPHPPVATAPHAVKATPPSHKHVPARPATTPKPPEPVPDLDAPLPHQ